MKKIKTLNVYPPIPIRNFDWCAYFEDEEDGVTGWGKTQEKAIQDLKDNVDD